MSLRIHLAGAVGGGVEEIFGPANFLREGVIL
jgi:hypothetical protein